MNKEGLRGGLQREIYWEWSRCENWMWTPCWEVWALGPNVCQMSLGILYLQFPSYYFISIFHFPNWTAAIHPVAWKLINNLWQITWNGVQGTMRCPSLSIPVAGGQILFGRIFSSQEQVCSCPVSSHSSSRKSPHASGGRHGCSNGNSKGFSRSSGCGVMFNSCVRILSDSLAPFKHQRQ